MSVTQQVSPVQSAQKKLYKSRTRSWKYFFKNGTPAIFINGWYATADAGKIAEIEAEIAAGHPEFYVDPHEAFLTVDRENPMAALEARIRQQIYAEMAAAAGNPGRDMGSSDQGTIKPQSTRDIASVAHGNGPAADQAQQVQQGNQTVQQTMTNEKLLSLMTKAIQVPPTGAGK